MERHDFVASGGWKNSMISTAVRMRSIDIWRLQDGKLIEHRDELILLGVFRQIGG
jgi:hypothetical protein